MVEKGNSTDVMYLDFCKTFDLVPPDILIKKGECYKIIALNGLKNQLTGTSQYVIVNGETSLSRCVSTAVLQRMVLAPKLFNTSNHVLKEKKSSHYRLYLQTTQTLGE